MNAYSCSHCNAIKRSALNCDGDPHDLCPAGAGRWSIIERERLFAIEWRPVLRATRRVDGLRVSYIDATSRVDAKDKLARAVAKNHPDFDVLLVAISDSREERANDWML